MKNPAKFIAPGKIFLLSALSVMSSAVHSRGAEPPICAVFTETNVEPMHRMFSSYTKHVYLSYACVDQNCRGSLYFNGSEIYSFESTPEKPMELCVFAIQKFDMTSLCDGALLSAGMRISRPTYGKTRLELGEDLLDAIGINIKYSSFPGFSPKVCIPFEFPPQIVPECDYFSEAETRDSADARIEITRVYRCKE